MNIRYRVTLTQYERDELGTLLSGGQQAARKLKRAQILLAADAGVSDEEIAVNVGGSTVYRTKRRFVEGNLENKSEDFGASMQIVDHPRAIASVAPIIAQLRQHLGIVLTSQDCADDPQTSRTGNVDDHVVELKIHLCQRLLHMLNMRGRVLEQTLALTYVCSQLSNLAFGPKTGSQQTERMKLL